MEAFTVIRLLWVVCMLLFMTVHSSAQIIVQFLDVGQADAAIVVCDNEILMIDGGNAADSQFIYSYLSNTLNIEHIDYMVSTHPHEDHVGGLAAALNACTVGTVYSPVKEYDDKPFNSFLKYVTEQGKEIVIPRRGDTFNVGGAIVTFLSEADESFDTNNASLVLRIDYGKISFLFTGDIEMEAEDALLTSGVNLKATILKVGHHGSRSSSSEAFLAAVSPQYAVISVGTDNTYGHPAQETLNRLVLAHATVLRTDKHGTIIFTSDGEKLGLQLTPRKGR